MVATGGTVRIIGGRLRSRRIVTAAHAANRPTPNRIREAVFHKLADHLVGAHCLDAFAGSGALGFEAVSRGATSVTFVEPQVAMVKLLRDNATALGVSDAVRIYRATIADFLRRYSDVHQPFRIVFCDAPFATPLLPQTLDILSQHRCVDAHTLVYCEYPAGVPPSSPHWQSIGRGGRAGSVCYDVLRLVNESTL